MSSNQFQVQDAPPPPTKFSSDGIAEAWDPLWLELGSGDTSAPITPALSIVSTSRRRRKTRLDANLMAETEAGDETRGEVRCDRRFSFRIRAPTNTIGF